MYMHVAHAKCIQKLSYTREIKKIGLSLPHPYQLTPYPHPINLTPNHYKQL